MILESLEITHLRNLQHLKLIPHPTTNFIIGQNGSGKTSILEAIALLSNGRSFRAADPKKVISNGASQLVVFANLVSTQDEGVTPVGISKSVDGSTHVRINGITQKKISTLAAKLPVVVIDTDSIEVVDGGPSVRRSLLDWGMFHVKHSYLHSWQRYRQILKQKNALIKSGKSLGTKEIAYWNEQLAVEGTTIDEFRSTYVTQLNQIYQRTTQKYLKISQSTQLKYRHGWNREKYDSLKDCLNASTDQEIERKSCLYGPHRGDLTIQWEDGLVKDICSRGQKKLVLYGVKLAQVALMREMTDRSPLLLLDDLPAELDKNNIENVTRFLMDFPCQTFITAISEQSINETLLSQLTDHHMFHVKHGYLTDIE